MATIYTVVDSKGRVHEVESMLTDEEAIAILKERIAKTGDQFCSKIVQESKDRFGWSQQWRSWGHIVAMRELQRQRENKPRVDGEEGFSRIVGMLEKAHQGGIEFPKIRVETHDGIGVMLTRSGPNSKAPGSVFVGNDEPFHSRTNYGRITSDGKWLRSPHCTDAIEAIVRELARDPAGIGALIGRRTGTCCFCRRRLDSAASVRVGYGPICADRFGLPWGEIEE